MTGFDFNVKAFNLNRLCIIFDQFRIFSINNMGNRELRYIKCYTLC